MVLETYDRLDEFITLYTFIYVLLLPVRDESDGPINVQFMEVSTGKAAYIVPYLSISVKFVIIAGLRLLLPNFDIASVQ